MILRGASMADAGLLLAWRNDPQTLKASIAPTPVGQVPHLAWLAAVIEDPNRELLLALVDDEPVGTVRLDMENGVAELSWTVSPDHRQKGYGTKIVKCAVARADGPVRAVIRRENAASRRIAEAAGLRLSMVDGELTIWSNETE